jgi:hypothetical protein
MRLQPGNNVSEERVYQTTRRHIPEECDRKKNRVFDMLEESVYLVV